MSRPPVGDTPGWLPLVGTASGSLEPPGEVRRGRASFCLRDVGRRAGGDDLAARVAATRAEVDDPVGGGDRVEVVLDQDDGVAGVDEPVQLTQQERGVRGVQSRGRLVEQVERVTAAGPLQLGGELDALRLPAAELGGRLPEP